MRLEAAATGQLKTAADHTAAAASARSAPLTAVDNDRRATHIERKLQHFTDINRYLSSAIQFFCPNIYYQPVTDPYITSRNGGAISRLTIFHYLE